MVSVRCDLEPAATPGATEKGIVDETRRHSAVATTKQESGGNFLSDPIVSFDGLHVGDLLGDDCSIGGFASDDSGAVGFDHYVQVVNTAMTVYDKSGNVVAGPISTTTFWHNQPDCGGDQNLERCGGAVRSIRQSMDHRRPGGGTKR